MDDELGKAPLTIRLLGNPSISYDGRPLSFRTRKVLALLIYLVVQGGTHSRESLKTLLWPESTADNVAATLRGTLSRLRKSLQQAGDFLILDGDSVAFDFGTTVDLDLAWLSAAAASEIPEDELAPILSLDRGEFLAGFSLPDAPNFDTWVAIQGEACQREVEKVYDRLTQYQLSAHQSSSAVEATARWLARAPYSEVAYRRLMAAQALTGDRPAALKNFTRLKDLLDREFSVEPSRETIVLADQIRNREYREVSPGSAKPTVKGTVALGHPVLPFVGRAEEHARLVSAYNQVVDGGARVVVLLGSAGVGKTRLVEAFKDWVSVYSPGVEIWQGQVFEIGGQLPYEAVNEALRQRLDRENAPEDLLDDIWLSELSQLMPELRARYPDLPPPMAGDAEYVRSRLFEALATLGSSLVTNNSGVLILDDLQWADPGTWKMIHYLARRWAEMSNPILLVLIVRRENFARDDLLRNQLASIERYVPTHRVLMEPIDGVAVKQLVARMSGTSFEDRTTGSFAEWLWAETQGLPFFIEALLQMLVEQGVLTRRAEGAGGFDFSAALDHVQATSRVLLPPGVREVIKARLAQHSKNARELLLAASVLGQACSFSLLCQVADLEEIPSLEAIENLLDSHLLVERSDDRKPYQTAHDYIREVVYSESREVRRRIFHRRALIALEADRAPSAECAYHALAALLDEPAFRFSLAAGNEALATYAYTESLSHYENARQAARQMLEKGSAVDSHYLRMLYQNRGRTMELIQDYPAAQENYQEMRHLAAETHDKALQLAGLTAQCIIHANHTTVFNPTLARELGETALNLAMELRDQRAESEALMGLMLAENYGDGNSLRTLEYGNESLSIARELGLKEQMGSVMINLCWPYVAQVQLEKALDLNSEALAIWNNLANQQMLLETNIMRLFLLAASGDLNTQFDTAQQAQALSHLTGNKSYQHISLQFMGRVLCSRGQFGESLANFKAALALSESAENPFAKQGDYDGLISFYLLTGAPDEADSWADKLFRVMESDSMPVWRNFFLANIAEAKIACGKLAEGQAILNEAIEAYVWNASWSNVLIPIIIADAHLQLALGTPELAFGIREDQLDQLRSAGFGLKLAEELWVRGKTLLAINQVEQAELLFLKAIDAAERQQERSILWQILADLSDLEGSTGNMAGAEKAHLQALEIVSYISEKAGADPVRSSFLGQFPVSQLLS